MVAKRNVVKEVEIGVGFGFVFVIVFVFVFVSLFRVRMNGGARRIVGKVKKSMGRVTGDEEEGRERIMTVTAVLEGPQGTHF